MRRPGRPRGIPGAGPGGGTVPRAGVPGRIGGGVAASAGRKPVGAEGIAFTVEACPSPSASAFTNATAVGQRSSGRFASAFRSARISGSGTSRVDGTGIGSCTCFMSTATGVSAAKGTRPVSIS
jgi:hypothetical protein